MFYYYSDCNKIIQIIYLLSSFLSSFWVSQELKKKKHKNFYKFIIIVVRVK